jgi:NAD-dependent dihydropyrimidine dehydrogenase PreA subunit
MKRNIVRIDENLCNGCGQCVSACAEGAIQLIDGKARLVSDVYCDGLGACLGECPQGAITIEEREAAAFDEKAVAQHLAAQKPAVGSPSCPHTHAAAQGESRKPAAGESRKPVAAGFDAPIAGGCPGTQARVLKGNARLATPPGAAAAGAASLSSSAAGCCAAAAPSPRASALAQWPVQLHLVSPQAPYFADCDLLVAADCVAFAMGDFHESLLEGHSVAIACPKLDNAGPYADKLAAIFSHNNIRHLTVAIMKAPCCRGLAMMVNQALRKSGKDIPLALKVISLDGHVKLEQTQ